MRSEKLRYNAPIIVTDSPSIPRSRYSKPIYHSQKVLKEEADGMIFSIQVIWNYELERELLGFGEFIKALFPRRLKNKIVQGMKVAGLKYEK